MGRVPVLVALLFFPACASEARSPEQTRLDGCLANADRNKITSAQVEPGNRFSYRYKDTGGSGPEREKFMASMQGRAPAYPVIR